jgi:hypothetical protein
LIQIKLRGDGDRFKQAVCSPMWAIGLPLVGAHFRLGVLSAFFLSDVVAVGRAAPDSRPGTRRVETSRRPDDIMVVVGNDRGFHVD